MNVLFKFKEQRGFSLPILVLLGVVLAFLAFGVYYTWVMGEQSSIANPSTSALESPPSNVASVLFENPEPPFYLVVNGFINEDWSTVSVLTTFVSLPDTSTKALESNSEAEFELVLKKDGIDYYRKPIDFTSCAVWDIDYCAEYNHSYGDAITYYYNVAKLPDTIEIVHNSGKVVYSKTALEEPFPELKVTRQEFDGNDVVISWEGATENELAYFVYVSNNDFKLGDDDRATGKFTTYAGGTRQDYTQHITVNDSSIIFTPRFEQGPTKLAVYATDGLRTRVFYSKEFDLPPKKPKVSILNPEDGSVYASDELYLNAYVENPVTRLVCTRNCSDMTFRWTSDISGLLSTERKTRELLTELTPGTHNITLEVKSANGEFAKKSVQVLIE